MANQSAWFALLVGVALKSTVVLGAAWIVVALLRGRSAAARHLIWTAAAAAVLALPLLTISLPALQVVTPDALAPQAGVLLRTTATAGVDVASPVSLRRSSVPVAPVRWRPNWRLSLMLLWAAGSAVALAQMLAACAGMWRVRRTAKPSDGRSLSAELAFGLGIRQEVEVLETCEESMPMTFGILRPAVFLPCDAAEWSEQRLRIVLLHELAHVRRCDVATHLLARLSLILHWWNPLAWMAWREFLKERERATDDLVLQAGALASDYARHLLDVARAMQSAPVPGCVAVAMARRSQLEGRLIAILDSRVSRKTAGRASAIVAVVVGISIVAPLAAVRAQEKAPPIVPDEVAVAIRLAVAQKNPEMLEKPADALIKLRQYDEAKPLLDSAVAIRESVSGSQSREYGLGLMKIADLEKKRNHAEDAEIFYAKALEVLGDRPETVPALMFLGLKRKDSAQAFNYFERVQRVDPSQAGPATMWMALIREREQKPAEAEALYRSALAVENPASVESASAMELFARFLGDQGRDEEALDMLGRAKVILYGRRPGEGAAQTSGRVVFSAGGDVKNPIPLVKYDPEYSLEARFARYSGTVVCSLEIDPDGKARNIQVTKGVGLGLDEKAIEAIEKWRFKPGMKNEVAVTVKANIEINFRLL